MEKREHVDQFMKYWYCTSTASQNTLTVSQNTGRVNVNIDEKWL